jgi:hypothetical protein
MVRALVCRLLLMRIGESSRVREGQKGRAPGERGGLTSRQLLFAWHKIHLWVAEHPCGEVGEQERGERESAPSLSRSNLSKVATASSTSLASTFCKANRRPRTNSICWRGEGSGLFLLSVDLGYVLTSGRLQRR